MVDKIKVGSVVYDVEEVEFVEINGNKNYMGKCDYHNTKIEILSSLSEERKKDVLVHELVHAIFDEAGFDDQDEDIVNRFGKVLCRVLIDNSKII